MNNKIRYSLREKELLDVCTEVVKDMDIRNFLLSMTGARCEKISKSNYKPVKSSLNIQYYALISQMVIKAIKLICDTIYFGECKTDLDREKNGILICKKYLLEESELKKIEEFEHKIYEFENKKNQIKTNSFHLVFEYIDFLTLFEDAWRKGTVNNILRYDIEFRKFLIEEVKSICKIVYKDFVEPNIEIIKKSFFKNPEFTSKISGFVGDSNFIINKDLYNLKTKHKSMPSQEDVCQSILYYLISRCNKIYYQETKNGNIQENLIEKLYIYNTRYGDKYEIKLNNLSDIYVENIMEEVYYMYKNALFLKKNYVKY